MESRLDRLEQQLARTRSDLRRTRRLLLAVAGLPLLAGLVAARVGPEVMSVHELRIVDGGEVVATLGAQDGAGRLVLRDGDAEVVIAARMQREPEPGSADPPEVAALPTGPGPVTLRLQSSEPHHNAELKCSGGWRERAQFVDQTVHFANVPRNQDCFAHIKGASPIKVRVRVGEPLDCRAIGTAADCQSWKP